MTGAVGDDDTGAGDNTADTGAIGVIGVGEIARAIVDGLCGGPGDAPVVFLSPRNAAVAAELAERHRSVRVCADNQEVVDRAPTVIVSVRPDVVPDVLRGLRVPAGRLVVSAVAGVPHEVLHGLVGDQVTIVRTIPLPAVAQRRGLTAIHPAHPRVAELFDALGGTLAVDDPETLTAIQTATATISTHLHYLALVAEWLTERGVPDADTYVRTMFLGVTGGLADPTRTLRELGVAHETPHGINEQLRRTWLTEPNRHALAQALDEVHDRLTP